MAAAAPGIRGRIEHLLLVEPDSKPRVYAQVAASAEIVNLNYWLELALAAGIATLGLVLNSPAVVIGAMLISPLMGPILAAGLALAAADLYLGIRALLSVIASVAGSVLFSAALVMLLPFQVPTTEILNRTQPNLLDLAVAIFSGLAGSIVVARGGGAGGITALPGVAIAVSLMPPLCAVGFGVGASFSRPIIAGAGLLFLANLAAIVASAFVVFFVIRMDAPDVRAEINRAIVERASHDRLYALLERTALARGLGRVGKLRWRVLMLVAVLAVLFVPLREALGRVHAETLARGAVRDAVRHLVPAENVIAQQIRVSPERVGVDLVVTEHIAAAGVAEAERSIRQRTGKEARLNIRTVAAETDIASLRAQLSQLGELMTPPPPPAASEDLNAVRAELLPRLERPLRQVWPAGSAELASYEMGFDPNGVIVHVTYRARRPLDDATRELLARTLSAALGVRELNLLLERERSGARR